MGAAGLRRTAAAMNRGIEADERDLQKSATWIVGDWNFLRPGDSVFAPHREGASHGDWRPARARQPRRPWETVFVGVHAHALELAQPAPTHFCAASGTAACLDRIFVGIPSWAVAHMRGTASTCRSERVGAITPRCHAPSLRRTPPGLPTFASPNTYISRQPTFAERSRAMVFGAAHEWEEGDVFGRLSRVKGMAHAAAHVAQAGLDMQPEVSPEVRAQKLVAIGTAVRTGDMRLATRLRERLAKAREVLTKRDMWPALSDPTRYACEVAPARCEAATEADDGWHTAQADPKAKRAKAQETNAKHARARARAPLGKQSEGCLPSCGPPCRGARRP